jgi:hypothetical protein
VHSIPPPTAHPDPGARGLRTRFGIEDAIRLVRRLPFDQNRDLVTTVLRGTLESLGVGLRDVIDDATRRQGALRAKARTLNDEIAGIEARIREVQAEIEALRAEHAETTAARARLEHIEAIHRGMSRVVYSPYDL